MAWVLVANLQGPGAKVYTGTEPPTNQEAGTFFFDTDAAPPPGPAGPQGPEGPQGPPGADGQDATWWSGTQAEYDAVVLKNPNTLYIVKG